MTAHAEEQAAESIALQRKRLRHDERRRMIINATLLCLARDGTEGTSLRSVRREVGVAPSLVMHFFSSWRDLLSASYRTLVGRPTEGQMLMLDSVWMEFSLNPGRIDEARTHRLCWFWLDLALART